MERLKKALVAVSAVWLSLDIILIIYSLFYYQYAFNSSNIAAVTAVLIFPVIALILSVIYQGNGKILVSVFSILLGLILLLQVYYIVPAFSQSVYFSVTEKEKFTDNFDAYATQFVSKTEKTENYLDIEDICEEHREIVRRYFPETIPDSAINADYSFIYHCSLFTTEEITASWELSESDFIEALEKERLRSAPNNHYSHPRVTQEDGKTVFEYANDLIRITFDKDNNRVEYFFGYYD